MIHYRALFELPKNVKFIVVLLWDLFAVALALIGAFAIRLGLSTNAVGNQEWLMMLLTLVFAGVSLLALGSPKQVIRFMGINGALKLLLAMTATALFLHFIHIPLNAFLPSSIPFIFWTLASIGVTLPRLIIYLSVQSLSYRLREKCLVFGASETGLALVQTLRQGKDLLPVAFVDDKSGFQGRNLLGLPVVSRKDIPALINKHGVTKMLLAVTDASKNRRKELISELEPFALTLLTTPNLQEVASGNYKIDELREVRVEELLGRDPVPPIRELLHINIANKVVMVTGAGGSIGSELCRQIAALKPAKLVLFELSEFNLYSIEAELKDTYPGLSLVPFLGSVQDGEWVRNVVVGEGVQTIYHAAAYKHVPIVEDNIGAGIRNNVFGTANCALISSECNVEKFVLVSTDKAVRPTNVMGATKRMAELFVQGLASLDSQTEFAIVRFGNVLGSSGSVMPRFREQIREGGPITVTHPDIIRYFMTIPEAAQLVIQAGAMGTDGEVFVLDMGEPVKILDLAKRMAHLMGYSTDDKTRDTGAKGDIEIVFSGLRPGEKLYEELLIDDADVPTEHPRILGANEEKIGFDEVVVLLDGLNQALTERDQEQARQMLQDAPLAYTPNAHHGAP